MTKKADSTDIPTAQETKAVDETKAVEGTKHTFGQPWVVKGAITHVNKLIKDGVDTYAITVTSHKTGDDSTVFLNTNQVRGFGLGQTIKLGTKIVVSFLRVTKKDVYKIKSSGVIRHYDTPHDKFVGMRLLSEFEEEQLKLRGYAEILSEFEAVAPSLALTMRSNAKENIFADVE